MHTHHFYMLCCSIRSTDRPHTPLSSPRQVFFLPAPLHKSRYHLLPYTSPSSTSSFPVGKMVPITGLRRRPALNNIFLFSMHMWQGDYSRILPAFPILSCYAVYCFSLGITATTAYLWICLNVLEGMPNSGWIKFTCLSPQTNEHRRTR